jgi:outer membrane lipoprotein
MSSTRIVAGGLCGLVLAVAGGCSYPIAKQYRLEARKDLTIAMVQEEPDEYKGALVIWGGIILQTTNEPEGTELTILQTPLDRAGVPRAAVETEGRFLARAGRFLDPEVWRRGQRVILAGEIEGVESRPLDNATYAYPVLAVKQLHLWLPAVMQPYYPSYGWLGGGWYGPDYPYPYPYYSYPYYYHYGYGFGHRGHGGHEGHRR